MEKDVFKFDKTFEGNKVIPLFLGRLQLCDGSIVRIIFTPEGLKLVVSQNAIDNKSLIVTKRFEPGLICSEPGG